MFHTGSFSRFDVLLLLLCSNNQHHLALVVAARIHGFKREVDQVVRVVRICDVTIKKRLFEFEKTGASSLTPAEFEVVELEMEMDPPCYTKGQQRERERQRKRKAIELARRRDEEEAAAAAGQDEEEEGATTGKRARAGTHSLSEEEEVESGFCGRASRTNGEAGEEQEGSVDRSQELGGGKGKEKEGEGRASEGITQEMQEKMREIMQDSAIRQLDADLNHRAIEESDYSDGPTSTQHQPPSSASSSSSFNFTSQSDFLEGGDPYYWEEVDDGGKLEELDDDELDGYLRTPDEAKLTAVVWEEMNKDWLIANEEKKKQEALKWPNGKPTSVCSSLALGSECAHEPTSTNRPAGRAVEQQGPKWWLLQRQKPLHQPSPRRPPPRSTMNDSRRFYQKAQLLLPR